MHGPLFKALTSAKPAMADAANEVLRDWDYEVGGACDAVVEALAGVVGSVAPNAAMADGGQDGDDHAWLIVRLGDEVLGVDVPPHHYEVGGGYSWRKIADEIEPCCVEIFETWWPNDMEIENRLRSHSIYESIRTGTVTEREFNRLIETSMKSVRERVRRVTEPIDHNRMNDDSGHSRTSGPNFAARAAKRPGGGSMNDPRKTGRGRNMLKRQARKHGVSESTYHLYACPECGGRLVNGDPANGTHFRGSGKCLDCSHSLALVHSDMEPLRKDVPAHELCEDVRGAEGWLCETCRAEYDDRPEADKCPDCSGDIVPNTAEHRVKYGAARDDKKAEAVKLILDLAQPDDLCSVYWNRDENSIRVSNGDWAEYDTGALYAALEKLLGDGKVEMEAEIGRPDGDEWERIELKPVKSEGAEYPKTKFREHRTYDPVCPHCDEVMGEKSYVPDRDTVLVRMKKINAMPKESMADLLDGGPREDLGPYLFRHRGECYDKGPFTIDWPKTQYDEAADFLLKYGGVEITEASISSVKDKGRLSRLATRLMREGVMDRDWLWKVKRAAEAGR